MTVLQHKTYPTFASVIDNIHICVCRQLSSTDKYNKVQEELFRICCYQLIFVHLRYIYIYIYVDVSEALLVSYVFEKGFCG